SPDELTGAVNNYKRLTENGTKKNIDALLHNYRQIDKTLQIAGIPVMGGIDFITVSEIICCKASSNYAELHLANGGKITATKTLKWIEDLLSEHVFFRVHDSYLINLNHIKKYLKGGEGGFVMLTGHKEIAVSRRKKDEFLKVLTGLKIISGK
ncbi:MAG TPA: LytTR family DNA-binding domain-containing protein, partial [Panacibacter sp.]|nr:LytTR family DNA-binding domain-containing protein [Panacibacter sp.]